jgi:hypothetical protein
MANTEGGTTSMKIADSSTVPDGVKGHLFDLVEYQNLGPIDISDEDDCLVVPDAVKGQTFIVEE